MFIYLYHLLKTGQQRPRKGRLWSLRCWQFQCGHGWWRRTSVREELCLMMCVGLMAALAVTDVPQVPAPNAGPAPPAPLGMHQILAPSFVLISLSLMAPWFVLAICRCPCLGLVQESPSALSMFVHSDSLVESVSFLSFLAIISTSPHPYSHFSPPPPACHFHSCTHICAPAPTTAAALAAAAPGRLLFLSPFLRSSLLARLLCPRLSSSP